MQILCDHLAGNRPSLDPILTEAAHKAVKITPELAPLSLSYTVSAAKCDSNERSTFTDECRCPSVPCLYGGRGSYTEEIKQRSAQPPIIFSLVNVDCVTKEWREKSRQ